MQAALFEAYLKLQEGARARGWMRRRPLRKLSRSLYTRLRCGERIATTCRGLTWCLDVRDPYFTPSLILEGGHEPYETEYFAKLVGPGMTVVDVGAHVGWYTLLAAQRVGASGRVVAFEPDPANYALLVQNVTANGFRNVETVQQAVSDGCRQAAFFLDPKNPGGHRLADWSDGRPSIPVEVTSLDAFFSASLHPIDVVKIDTEGVELSVWRGMQRVLQRSPHLRVMMEFSPEALLRCGASPERLLAECQQSGFTAYWLNGQTQRVLPKPLEELLAICRQGDQYTNLFLFRTLDDAPGSRERVEAGAGSDRPHSMSGAAVSAEARSGV